MHPTQWQWDGDLDMVDANGPSSYNAQRQILLLCSILPPCPGLLTREHRRFFNKKKIYALSISHTQFMHWSHIVYKNFNTMSLPKHAHFPYFMTYLPNNQTNPICPSQFSLDEGNGKWKITIEVMASGYPQQNISQGNTIQTALVSQRQLQRR